MNRCMRIGREKGMNKKRYIINIIGWIYMAGLTIIYYSESFLFLTTGFSGFIIFMVGIFMVMYSPKVVADFRKWFIEK